MTFDQKVSEIRSLYQHCDKSDNKLKRTDIGILPQWRIDFLLSINAIKFTDYAVGDCVVINDYPMLVIYKGGVEDRVVDMDGNISLMEDKIKELEQSKTGGSGKIKYYARNYSAYLEMMKPEKKSDENYY